MSENTLQNILLNCHQNNGIKFGQFILKSGISSPIYIDLRFLASIPQLLKEVSDCVYAKIMESKVEFDVICGVPYTALPIATCVSVQHNIPMIMRRKESKSHGTKQLIEGLYKTGQKVLIIEDIISSGTSVLETALALHNSGLIVTDAVVFLDREQNGKNNLKQFGINVVSVITLSKALEYLMYAQRISKEEMSVTSDWLKANQLSLTKLIINESKLSNFPQLCSKNLSFLKRANFCTNELTRKLFLLMEKKRSNLCVAFDFTKSQEVLDMADKVGPHISILKTHVDIITDFTPTFIENLKQIAAKHEFLIFEDRKFSDIGKTVQLQFGEGIYQISDWADIVNAHIISGPTIVNALKDVIIKKNMDLKSKGCVLIGQMSSKGNLTSKSYSQSAYSIANDNQDFVIGFISQSRIASEPNMIHLTPGVHIFSDGDDLDQNYITPEVAIIEREADIIIVGRGITNSKNPEETANLYKQRAFNTYLNKVDK